MSATVQSKDKATYVLNTVMLFLGFFLFNLVCGPFFADHLLNYYGGLGVSSQAYTWIGFIFGGILSLIMAAGYSVMAIVFVSMAAIYAIGQFIF